jgi:hypothetical protein
MLHDERVDGFAVRIGDCGSGAAPQGGPAGRFCFTSAWRAVVSVVSMMASSRRSQRSSASRYIGTISASAREISRSPGFFHVQSSA